MAPITSTALLSTRIDAARFIDGLGAATWATSTKQVAHFHIFVSVFHFLTAAIRKKPYTINYWMLMKLILFRSVLFRFVLFCFVLFCFVFRVDL